MAVSEVFMGLVAGLGRAGHPGSRGTPADVRDRFVLYMLAHHADEQGHCTFSATELEALTGIPTHEVRLCVRRLCERGWIDAEHSEGRANHYLVNRRALERDQVAARLRRAADLYLLVDYGLPLRAVRTLQKMPLADLNDLAAVIGRYRAAPAGERVGFHDFLNLRNMGPQTARLVLEAFDAYVGASGAAPRVGAPIG